jgi:hypothetical protein
VLPEKVVLADHLLERRRAQAIGKRARRLLCKPRRLEQCCHGALTLNGEIVHLALAFK